MADWIPAELRRILAETREVRQAYLVGGCVRDWLLGRPGKDFDVEVFGVSYEQLVSALGRWGRTDLVGRSYGVVKLSMAGGTTYDFTVARRDSKVAPGHKGFSVALDPAITLREAAARRDFTINSLMYDPHTDEVLDFFGGREDLANRVLRHTSGAFVEDPLRVLRGMQFAARFELSAAPETVELGRRMKAGFAELADERVREEWYKWAALAKVPSAGLKFLQATEWLEHFPEIQALGGVPQDPEWHPEGDVFVHTCHCCDALADLPAWQQSDETSRIVYSLAILSHDLGKSETTHSAIKHGQWHVISPGHEEVGVKLAESLLERIHATRSVVERVLPLVRSHMAHLQEVTDRSVRRLARRLEPENIQGLCLIMTADAMGRPPRPREVPRMVRALEAKAAELQVEERAPHPILMGRHLLELGFRPGPKLGDLLRAAYEAQLEGKFFDLPEAFRWLVAEARESLPEEIVVVLQQRFAAGQQ